MSSTERLLISIICRPCARAGVHTSSHTLNTGVTVGLTRTIVKKIDVTRVVWRVRVNGGQLAESKKEKSNYSITCHNKGKALD